MGIDTRSLSRFPALARVRTRGGEARPALWRDGGLHDLSEADDSRLHSLDALLSMPLDEARAALEHPALSSLPQLDLTLVDWLAPVESQEVWAAGVTYRRSREARMEEAASRDVYAAVYEADRPELFFKAAGWRVVPPGGEVGIRSDSDWDVPEPELAVLSNSRGEVVAYACGNDMSSRSIEGMNPLYLPQAKVYDASCSIGPVAALAWHVSLSDLRIDLQIERGESEIFAGSASLDDMVRDLAELVAVLHAVYTLPNGAWLLTGTGIVPPLSYTAQPGDSVTVRIEGLGELRNRVKRIPHSGATALPRVRQTGG